MQLSRRTMGPVEVLVLRGSIHAEDDRRFSREFGLLRHEGRYRVVIDARELEYLNSRAVGDLVKFFMEASNQGGRVVMVRPSGAAKKILKAVGLSSLIASFDTVEEACRACGG